MPKKSTLQSVSEPQTDSGTDWDSGQLVTVRRETSFDTVESKLACLAHLVKNCAGGRLDRLEPEGLYGRDVAWGLTYILEGLRDDMADLNRLLDGADTDAVIGPRRGAR